MDEPENELDKFFNELSDDQKLMFVSLMWGHAHLEKNIKNFSAEEYYYLQNMNSCLLFYFMSLNGLSTYKMSAFLKEFDSFDEKVSLSDESIRLMVNKGKLYYQIFWFFFKLIPPSLEERGLPDILPRKPKKEEGKSMEKEGKV